MLLVLKAEQTLLNLRTDLHPSGVVVVRIVKIWLVLCVVCIDRHAVLKELEDQHVDVGLQEDLELLDVDLENFLAIGLKLAVYLKMLLLQFLPLFVGPGHLARLKVVESLVGLNEFLRDNRRHDYLFLLSEEVLVVEDIQVVRLHRYQLPIVHVPLEIHLAVAQHQLSHETTVLM